MLDLLPQDDPRAMRSRRDLRRINAWMLQGWIMRRLLATPAAQRPRTVLELGGGDGTLMLKVARRMASEWGDVTLLLLDRHDVVSSKTRDAFGTLGWKVESIVGDVFQVLLHPMERPIDLIVANLFLHHFQPEQLTWLTERAAKLAPTFVACEPRRGRLPLQACRMLWAIGCSDISRHDALTSVRAGFCGKELSALWPNRRNWVLDERAAGLFTHCFVARRRQEGGPA